jgi:hypothetical protein
MPARIHEDDGRIVIEGPDGKTALELLLESSDGQNTISIYPPEDGKRTKLSFFNGTSRPLSIEAHGIGDVYDPTNQHVAFYTEIPGMGTDGRILEWNWGDQWDGILRLSAGIAIAGKVGFNGQKPIDKPIVTGDRVLVVLKNLLAALASMGLIDDQTTL